jgi:predicted nucleic acid-binding protein
MNIFIDTNVFLSLYHFTNDQLDDLRKLQTLLTTKRATLFLPEQTELEFRRNRDNKLFDALKRLGQNKVDMQLPTFLREFDEFVEVRRIEGELKRALAALEQKATKGAMNKSLGADQTIASLFAKAQRIKSDSVITAARLRHEVGNPSGKPDSLGDAINWEALRWSSPFRHEKGQFKIAPSFPVSLVAFILMIVS